MICIQGLPFEVKGQVRFNSMETDESRKWFQSVENEYWIYRGSEPSGGDESWKITIRLMTKKVFLTVHFLLEYKSGCLFFNFDTSDRRRQCWEKGHQECRARTNDLMPDEMEKNLNKGRKCRTYRKKWGERNTPTLTHSVVKMILPTPIDSWDLFSWIVN